MTKNKTTNYQKDFGGSGRESGTVTFTLKTREKKKGKEKSETKATNLRCSPSEKNAGICKEVQKEVDKINSLLRENLASDEERGDTKVQRKLRRSTKKLRKTVVKLLS